MPNAKAYAAKTARATLEPFSLERRAVGDTDVAIEILYCGVCHSDIHQARGEWGGEIFPMVPGHEIVGRVTAVGGRVKNFRAGDLAGVGCFVNSCRKCESCQLGLEQFCESHLALTYNGTEMDEKTPTFGGYSSHIVVDENYTLRVPKNLDLKRVAPLLCAGITTYSPLKHWGVTKGQRVGVVGLGGLGHMAVKLAAAFGAEVTVLSRGKAKEADAKRLGAANYIATGEPNSLKGKEEQFHFIIDTVSAPHDLNSLLGLLRRDGTMTLVGVPPETTQIHAFPLISKRRSLTGSLIGGIRETQEMLDFCGKHEVMSDVEVIAIQDINQAYDRMIKGDVRYRFVIDSATLK